MADVICNDTDDWCKYNETRSLCYGDEKDCLTVKFKGTDISGTRGSLVIDRSWHPTTLTSLRYVDEVHTYGGDFVDFTVRIVGLIGHGATSMAKIEICYTEPPFCPEPTASITTVSNYNPVSGEEVKFTGYAYGGEGQEVTFKHWYFGAQGDTGDDEPLMSWTNDTNSPVNHTITLEVRNSCGGKTTATTVVTVHPKTKKTGIEIQFSDNLNGKDLIAYKAIRTIGDLWWTGPAFADGILWKGGRCAWSGINSSLKYNILVGDACQEKNAIDGIVPERPGYCAGDFNDGDNVIILARNPGFDFRIYTSANLVTLSGSTFQVVYLSSTSGDVIDEAFTGRICGLIGLSAGTECDAFWAEFYDPIFVANYMEIQATGKDMFGNERELGWLDHVAFIASIIGSLPAFNLFPFAGTVKNLGTAIIVLARKAMSLAGDELAKAGGAMADICVNAPEVIQKLIQSEIDELRSALVKVYGDVQGNKYVDDALGITGAFVERYHNVLDRFRRGQLSVITQEAGEILEHGKTNPDDILGLIDSFIDDGTLSDMTGKLIDDKATHSLGVMFESINGRRELLDADNLRRYTTESSKIASEAAGKSNVKELMEIPGDLEELPFHFMELGDELGESVGDNLVEAIEALSNEPSGNWKTKGMQFLDGKVLGWLAKVRGKPATTVHFHDAKTRYAKWKGIFDNLEDYQKFTFYTMLIWGIYETTSWVGTYIIPKWMGFFPEQAAFRQRQHNDNMEALSWQCKTANDYGRTDMLFAAVGLFRTAITEAEEHLEDNASEFKTGKVYEGFVTAIDIAKMQLKLAESWLGESVETGILKCTSNKDFFYVEIDGYPAGFSYANKSLLLETVPVGNHNVRIYKEGSGDCSKVIEITVGAMSEFDCQMDDSCVLPVPTIDAPLTAETMQGVQFRSSATTESLIKWLEWDFGDGDQSRQQNPSHLFWNAGDHLIQLTVTDDCGTVTVEHTILITPSGEQPGEPTPTETPAADLPAGTATVNVKRPVSSKTGRDIVWPTDCFIHIDGQYSGDTAPQPFSFGGWKELPIGKHTFKIIAEGYQDESVEIDLKIGDEIDWAPYMDPVGYTPPVGEPPVTDPPVAEPPASGEYAIEFLIPDGATMTLTPKTTVPHITVRSTFTDNMRRLSER